MPLCSSECFRLALCIGWFDPRRLWARQNSKEDGRRRQHEPDYKGTCDITCDCGKRCTRKLAAWLKTGRNGKFLTVSLKLRPEGDDSQAADADNASF